MLRGSAWVSTTRPDEILPFHAEQRMSEAQRELDRRLEAIVARLHRDPAVRAELAHLDQQAAAARLAELALLELKTDPAAAALLEQVAQDAGMKPS
jgi:hypothetical protein